jgi:SAM-dependent MidA family methyltransferase
LIKAFRKDEIVDPLSDPGNIDIISDVDFQELTTSGMLIPYGKIDQ